MSEDPGTLLRRLLDAALASARPALCLPPHLPEPPAGRTVVVGAGKAAATMAQAVEIIGRARSKASSSPATATACRRARSRWSRRRIRCPTPAAARPRRAFSAWRKGWSADDLALCLISGGGSALLTLPAPGVTLEDKQAVTGALLRSGAAIGEINAVRKHLSAIKGGRLGAACHPARLVSLLISDVPGDDPAVIGSGPTVPDPSTFADALAVLRKYGIDEPAAVIRHLEQGRDETPKQDDPRLAGAETRIVATPAMALAAAAEVAREAGYTPVVLGDALEGEARDLARDHARLARDAAPGTVLLSGGEATVTVTGEGRGGPNAEYALALALALDGAPGIFATACDTDGIDGTEDNAGALIAPDTLARGRAAGEDAAARLAANDAYGFFASLGDLVMTGPTLTNVNDFRAILVSHSG